MQQATPSSYGVPKIYRAAIIPFIVEDNKLLMKFMKPTDTEFGGDAFQLAKGRVELNETNEQAAIREGQEELGLFTGNIVQIEEVGNFMGRTTVFIAEIKDREMFGEPSFETAETSWMTLEEFNEVGRELHRPVVEAAYRQILRMLDLEEK